jgi:hypothetical protein
MKFNCGKNLENPRPKELDDVMPVPSALINKTRNMYHVLTG